MFLSPTAQLAYCTNIHPAQSWEETFAALKRYPLAVRSLLGENGMTRPDEPFGIGLRLSAQATRELTGSCLSALRDWLAEENCNIFTVNAFPYGSFHQTRVKEQVYRPDWSDPARLTYTKQVADLLSQISPAGAERSISTLPASFKAFQADEKLLFQQLIAAAQYLEELSEQNEQDFHLGLEPEPLGHFENTAETLAFFERLHAFAAQPDLLQRRLGINYDTCHFALQYEEAAPALDDFRAAGIRISKVHLSNTLAFDPQDSDALEKLREFNEPTYLHQVLCRSSQGSITRYTDLPEYFASLKSEKKAAVEGRCHFHIPLYEQPIRPFQSTLDHARDTLRYLARHPDFCPHFEIETYTWDVLPEALRLPIDEMIAAEYRWVVQTFAAARS